MEAQTIKYLKSMVNRCECIINELNGVYNTKILLVPNSKINHYLRNEYWEFSKEEIKDIDNYKSKLIHLSTHKIITYQTYQGLIGYTYNNCKYIGAISSSDSNYYNKLIDIESSLSIITYPIFKSELNIEDQLNEDKKSQSILFGIIQTEIYMLSDIYNPPENLSFFYIESISKILRNWIEKL